MFFASLLTLASILNPSSSFNRELSLTSCRTVEVNTVCNFDITAPGYGPRKFKLYKRDANGDLITLSTGSLDVEGKKNLKLKFGGVGTVNILFILFDIQNNPVAIDGAFILVNPDKRQLGEQYTPDLGLGLGGSYEEPVEDDADDYYDE